MCLIKNTNIVSGKLNGYTITAKDTSGSTVTANSSDSGNGGGSTVGAYQINTGLDVFVAGGAGVSTHGALELGINLLSLKATN